MKPSILPPLRKDLELVDGPPDIDGEKTYLIKDIVRNLFITISHDTFLVLSVWEPGLSPDQFIEHLGRFDVHLEHEQLERFLAFLSQNQLVWQNAETLAARRDQISTGKHVFDWFLHNYLFFKIPLLYPNKFLIRTNRLLNFIYTRKFFGLILGVFIFDLLFIGPRWEYAHIMLSSQGSFEIGAKIFLALLFTKTIHELGHAYTASRYGCIVPSLGIGLMVGFPVFYADVTDTWRLVDPRQRLHVAISGITAELCLSILSMALWIIFPTSWFSECLLFLALTTWITCLLINLNPLMRFDGYHIASDLLGEKNFQQKSFIAAKNSIRRFFGFGGVLSEARQRLVVFGFLSMLYRVIVITGIATILYHFVFRLLGLVLFGIEIWWFLVRPLWLEVLALRHYQQPVDKVRVAKVLSIGIILSGIVLFVPYSTWVTAPGVLSATQVTRIYTNDAGILKRGLDQGPRHFSEGEPIISLDQPALMTQLKQSALQVEILESKRSDASIADVDRNLARSLDAQIETARVRNNAFARQIEGLSPRAPFEGVFFPLGHLTEGQWLPGRAAVGDLVSGGLRVVAFVAEQDLSMVEPSAAVTFFDDSQTISLRGYVRSVSFAAAAQIPYPELVSSYGGPISAKPLQQGGLFISERAIYRVEIEMEGQLPMFRMSGTALIEGPNRSLIRRLWQAFGALFAQEAYIH